jgi:hypothetical protein
VANDGSADKRSVADGEKEERGYVMSSDQSSDFCSQPLFALSSARAPNGYFFYSAAQDRFSPSIVKVCFCSSTYESLQINCAVPRSFALHTLHSTLPLRIRI